MTQAQALAEAQRRWGTRIARVRKVKQADLRRVCFVGFMVWTPALRCDPRIGGRDVFESAGKGSTWEQAFADADAGHYGEGGER